MVTAAQPQIEFHESTRLPVANIRNAGDFPTEEFETIANVPVFREHETVTRSGRQIKFGRAELQAVADRCNQRIAETGDFAAITIGHTPSPEERAAGSPEPPVVGFAGPFRLGRLGHGSSISYAILADFHVRNEYRKDLTANPRRSPELWLEDRYEDMFLDPIALLAGQAPRLDLGLLYSAKRHGRELMKYAGPAMASPTSTFIPSQDYAAGSQTDKEPKMALTPDEVGQIVDAIEQLDWVTEVKSMLSTQLGAADGGVVGESPEPAIPPAAADTPPEGIGEAPADPAIEPAPEAPIEPAVAPEAGPPAPGGADPPAEPPASPPPAEKEPMAADPEGNVGRQGKLDALFAQMDEVDDESFAKYCASRQGGQQQYSADGADAGTPDAAATYDQTANEAPDIAGSTNAIDIGGGKKMYEAEVASGSVQGPKPEQPTQGSAEGSGTGPMGEGSADDVSGNAAGSYQAQAKYSRAIHQIDQMQAKLAEQDKQIMYERSARVNAERLGLLTQLQNQGYTIDPVEQLERCKYGKMNDEAFGAEIEFIAKSVQRVPFGDLPSASHSSLQDGHFVPGVQADRQKYSKDLSERALRICEAKAIAGESPDYQVELEKLQHQR